MPERRRDQLFQKLRLGGRKHGQQSNENAGSLEQLDSTRTDNPGKNLKPQVLESDKPIAVLSPGHSSQPDSTVLGPNAVTMTVPENKNYGTKESLWTRAYNRCREEAPKLVEDYLCLLAGTHEISEDTSDPMQVAKVVKKQKEIMEKKQWKLVFWHHEIIIREKIDHIVQAFRIFEGIGSAAASLDPVHAGIPWAGVCAILQLVTKDSEQHDQVLDGLVSITDLMNFYAQAEPFYLSQNVNTEPLVELYKLVLEFQMLAAGYFSRNTAARFTRNVFMPDGWSDKLTKVRKKDEECRTWVNLSVSKQVISKLDAHLSAVNNDAAQAQQILGWISNISVRDQHVFVRESKLGRPYWNTGRWLIEHRDFRQWAQSPSGIFYLEGGVGVGKSCLVSSVLEEYFKASLDRLAFFYCTRSTGDSFNSLGILRSILAQLSYTVHTKEISHSIRQRYNNRLNNVDGGSLSLRDCEDHIIELASGKRHITIIIDALDESDDHDKLLSSLKRVYGQSSNVHIFFSSRSIHLRVTEYFQLFSPVAITIVDQSKQEMQSFIETEIRSPDRRRNSCIEKLPELEKRFQDALVGRAGAMFRWAELQLDLFLNKKRPIRHWKDFESKLNKLISDSSLPTLNRAYDEIYLSNVEPGSFDEVFATKALRCILCAFQPLNVQQLVGAVAIDPEGEMDPTINLQYIMDICSNFIVVDQSDSVSLAHLSVREYLEQKKLDGKDVPIYTFAQTHRQLAESCLATILHTNLVDVANVSSRQRFLRYAMAFWPSHCEKIPEDRTTRTLSTLMVAMMGDKLSEWAVIARKISRKFVDSAMEFDRLRGVPAENPYPYIVCVWGFVEFFNETVQGAKLFTEPRDYQRTPLEVASFHGHLELVRRIIDTGPEKEIQRASTVALVEACREGHYEIAELLLGTGASPSPALESSFSGDFDRIAKLLIDHGAVINPPQPKFIWGASGTPLQLASIQGHLKIVEVLVNGGAEINIPGGFYGSALQRAIFTGHEDVVRFLLDHGADVNFGSGIAVSPLLAAANTGRHEIMRLLLERGADPNPFSDYLGTPLQWVSSSNLELVELLVKHGANVNGFGTKYGAPLEAAAANGQLDIVRFLLDSGADINAQVSGNKPALVSAARNGYYDVVQLLLARGVDVEKHGPRACWKASKHGHQGIVELLMGHGVQMPEQQDAFSSDSDERGEGDDGEDEDDAEDEDDTEDEE